MIRTVSSMSQFGLGLAASVAFLPGIVNAGTAPRWAALAVMIPLVGLLSTTPARLPWGWIALFIAPILISVGLHQEFSPEALERLAQLSILMMAFVLGASMDHLNRIWWGVAAGVGVSAVLAFLQYGGLSSIPQAVAPAGLFMNKNVLAESCLLALIISAGLGSIWLFILGFVGLALTMSKAAIGAAVITLILWLTHAEHGAQKWGAALVIGLIGLAATVPDWSSLAARSEIWGVALSGVTLLGNGVGAFQQAVPHFQYVHMEILELIYELGLLSLPIILGVLYWIRRYRGSLEETIILAVALVGLFSFPLHLPLTGFAMAIALGHVVGSRNELRLQSDLCGDWNIKGTRRSVSVGSESTESAGRTRGRVPHVVSPLSA